MSATAPVLTIRGLRVAYGSGPDAVIAVHGIDLEVHRGEVVAIVGESGSGKSTTAHAVVGLGPGRVLSGTIEFDGQRIDHLGHRALEKLRGAGIGLVPQDPASSLNPVTRIGEQIAEVLRIHGRADRRTARAEAIRILAEAGLDHPELRARQYPQDLSGGQRQRVLIGIALACAPDLVIADEPTSALDVTVQKRILDHLDARIAATGSAVLLITHDLGVAADRADRIVVMSGGRIVEEGTARQILTAPTHEYTRALLEAAPSIRTVAPRGRVAVAGSAGSQPAAGTPGEPAPQGEPLVSVDGLSKSFRVGRGRGFDAVRQVSFRIHRGRTLSLVGESGSGKSTTARIVARLETATSGQVSVGGRPVTALRGRELREFRRRVQLVHQNPYSALNPKLTVEQIVTEPLAAFGIGDRGSRRRSAREMLDQVALGAEYLTRLPAQLSGGQRQRVAIARALVLNPDLVVLDEPVSALDVRVQAEILDLLARLQRDHDLGYLFISHDLAVVRQISDDVVVMRHGVAVESGPVAEVFSDPQHEYTRELLEAIPGRLVAGR